MPAVEGDRLRKKSEPPSGKRGDGDKPPRDKGKGKGDKGEKGKTKVKGDQETIKEEDLKEGPFTKLYAEIRQRHEMTERQARR